MKILIVDDNIQWCLLIRKEIRAMYPNFTISIATDGREAIEAINQSLPDILILDIIMPIYDGVYVVNYIRKNYHSYNPIIYILSALSTEATISHLNACRIDYYSLKPLSEKTVALNIRFLIDQRKAVEQQKVYASDPVQIKRLIMDTFDALGIPQQYISTRDTAEALMLLFNNYNYINDITRKLYVETAKISDTSANAVERNIRLSRQYMIKANTKDYQKIFKSILDSRITNSSFLATLYSYLDQKTYH